MSTTRIGFLAAVLGLSLAACGTDAGPEASQEVTPAPAVSKLIGSWAMTSPMFRFSERITILSTGRFTDDYIFSTDRVVMENDTGTWSATDGVVTLAYDGDFVGTLLREYSGGAGSLTLAGGVGTQASGTFERVP
jgi:hypothetical protein